jgi:hypothetical protein
MKKREENILGKLFPARCRECFKHAVAYLTMIQVAMHFRIFRQKFNEHKSPFSIRFEVEIGFKTTGIFYIVEKILNIVSSPVFKV